MDEKEKIEICKKAIDSGGVDQQLHMVLEELMELCLSLLHIRRHRIDKPTVVKEIADAKIVLMQLEIMVDDHKSIENAVEIGLNSLNKRIKQKRLINLYQENEKRLSWDRLLLGGCYDNQQGQTESKS